MKPFSEKVKEARNELGLSQTQLGEAAGVSLRTILSYEKGEKFPRPATMLKLAKALKVSVKFLSDDECMNPVEDIEKDGYIEEARERYGAKGARDVEQPCWVTPARVCGAAVLTSCLGRHGVCSVVPRV